MQLNTFLKNIERARRSLADCLRSKGVGWLPAWHDLDDDGRREAFEAARLARRLEAALDPDGLSSTARAVLARLDGR